MQIKQGAEEDSNIHIPAFYLCLTLPVWEPSISLQCKALKNCKKIESFHNGFNISENKKEMLENWGIPIDRIDVFLRESAFNMKAGMCMLESSSALCFIRTL